LFSSIHISFTNLQSTLGSSIHHGLPGFFVLLVLQSTQAVLVLLRFRSLQALRLIIQSSLLLLPDEFFFLLAVTVTMCQAHESWNSQA
jgi:hypothetical protein